MEDDKVKVGFTSSQDLEGDRVTLKVIFTYNGRLCKIGYKLGSSAPLRRIVTKVGQGRVV